METHHIYAYEGFEYSLFSKALHNEVILKL
jgi:hypothetical protein